jgi:hypothetical protein
MKKQAVDRPAGAVASESSEIQITPEMIEAGLACYQARCPDTAIGDQTDRKMLAEIFRAMASLSRPC